jgi:hypothetical protein
VTIDQKYPTINELPSALADGLYELPSALADGQRHIMQGFSRIFGQLILLFALAKFVLKQ